MKTYIIVGLSGAGIGVITKLRELDPASKIICISEQKYLPYNKCLMADYICGTVDDKRLFKRGFDFFKKNNIELLLSTKVTKIVVDKKQVELNNNNFLSYDKLFLGLGTDAFIPEIPGLSKIENVFTFHTLSDAENISKFIKEKKVKESVVVGTGLSALEIADTLHSLGVKVTVLCRSNKILRSYLDQEGSNFIEHRIIQSGITVLKNSSITKVNKPVDKKYEIFLNNNKKIITEMLVFATGQKPNIELAQEAGIQIKDNRIVSNEKMQTSIPDIFVGGDVCLVKDIITGDDALSCTWPDAVAQGMVAASNMFGDTKIFPGVLSTISSIVFDVPFICCGSILNSPKDSEFIIKKDVDYYHKFLIHDDKLIGFLMMGKLKDVGKLKISILNKDTLSNF